MTAALDRMIAEMEVDDVSREMAAAAALRDWLIDAGYLSEDEIEEPQTEGEI